jgi:hypothetical protein
MGQTALLPLRRNAEDFFARKIRRLRPGSNPRYWVGRSLAEIVGSNPTGGVDICRECYVLSGKGLCDGQITRPEESYRMWYV